MTKLPKETLERIDREATKIAKKAFCGKEPSIGATKCFELTTRELFERDREVASEAAVAEAERAMELVEAIKESIAIADDYADSGISQPIRKALARYRSGKPCGDK